MNNFNTFWGHECILLTRVSTEKQDFSAQNSDLTTYAKSLGFTKIEIISTKESGFKNFESKEGFNLVIEHIKNNPNCKTIFVTELSRIGRNRQVITNIEFYLRQNKINLIVKDTNIKLFDEFGNESGGLMFAIYASFAESEMKQKKERFSRAKRKYFSEGVSITGSVLFGYDRIKDENIKKNIYVINPEQSQQIKQIYDWYISGIDGDETKSSISLITLECIKRGFNQYLHSKRNVNKCLKEQAYTGQKTTSNKMKNPAFWNYGEKTAPKYINASNMIIKYPVILSDSVYKSVQMKMKDRNTATDKAKHNTILSKMFVCPVCGHYYRGEYSIKNGEIRHFYRCSHSKAIVNKCENKSTLSMVQMDSVIWCFIKENISELIDKINSFYSGVDVSEIEQQIENLRNKIFDFENEIETENIIFRNSIKRATDRTQIIENYNNKINEINLKIEKIENVINERFELINDIELNQKSNKQDISNKINDIENSKSELKKYIRLLIKKIVPVYTDNQFTVLNLKSIENLGSSLNLSGWDGDGIPEMKENVSEIDYFIIIDKRDNHRIKVKYFENNIGVKFDSKYFIFNENTTTLNDIFSMKNVNVMDEPFLSMGSDIRNYLENNLLEFNLKDLIYNRFPNELYNEDLIKRK